MEIRLRSSGEVMYEGEFRTRFASNLPSTPLTQEWLDSYTTDPAGDIVFEGPQAAVTYPYEFSYRNGVVQDDQGRWFTKYSAGPVFADIPATDTEPAKTAAEQMVEYKARMDEEQARRIRADRNTRLNDSDWSQIGDSTADKTAWAAYRQALRDIPTSVGFPWNVVWPESP
jgi:hypothetical protein